MTEKIFCCLAANGYISRSWLCRMARPSWTQHGSPTSKERKGVSPKRIPTALHDRTMPLTVLAAVRGIIAPAGCSTIEYGKRKGFYGSKRMGVTVQPVRQTEQQLLQHLQGCTVRSCGNTEQNPAAEQGTVRHNRVPEAATGR